MRSRKRIYMGVILGVLALSIWFYFGKEEKTKSIQIGVSLYLEDDTFVEKILSAMEQEALAYEEETGTNIILNVSVANGSQRTQNEQVKRYIEMGYDAVCVNLVDRTNAAAIIDLGVFEDKSIPIVFFNREPVAEDIMRRDMVYYVGADAKQSAVLQGESVVECYHKYPKLVDKNEDGVLQYVMLEGEMGHQDAIMRSDYSLQTIVNMGVPLHKLASGTADWNRKRASVLMEQWTENYGDEIELVLCNNDDMALGALDILSKAGINAAVFGIDATDVGMQALEEGALWATVDCNSQEQGQAVLRIAADLATKGTLSDDLELTQERYVRVPLIKKISPSLG
ncbi:galactose ABC transporter substrate-binding protein [Anaerotignum sp.]|uniref:galactose ABC transporter substrate-binding protein n=1 Tax=Anaerotignum sp. TaxID=2039241 RepID=UPI0028A86E79|nr:galactose ABC transporter substrate-binding protein [Anaerotignum sp.]